MRNRSVHFSELFALWIRSDVDRYVFIRRVALQLGPRNRTYENSVDYTKRMYKPMRSTDAKFTLSLLAPPLKRGRRARTNCDDRRPNKSYQIVPYPDINRGQNLTKKYSEKMYTFTTIHIKI